MNYFDSHIMAENYAKGRPYYHPLILSHIQETLGIEKKVKRALDIACGSGLSTRMLCELAEETYGTDTSKHMLAFAQKDVPATFSIAQAENQPFPNQNFELISVSSGVHWFDIDKFLEEAHRLLMPRAFLILYDNFFLGSMP
ncbi:MAG: class I SAM-dependent methyltransferase, partial [Bacteroidota bacterium]